MYAVKCIHFYEFNVCYFSQKKVIFMKLTIHHVSVGWASCGVWEIVSPMDMVKKIDTQGMQTETHKSIIVI